MAAAAVRYHSQNSHLFLLPNFQKEALQDEVPVSEALTHVLAIRKRKDPQNVILKRLMKDSASENVGHLRALSDSQWSSIKIPAMCRVFLKQLVKQSIGLTQLQQLECDFNNGKAYDWDSLTDNLENLANMGFQRAISLEALVVTQNKGIEVACNYLFLDKGTQKKEREKRKLAIGKCVSPDQHHSQTAAREAARELPSMGKLRRQQSIKDLRKELDDLKDDLKEIRQKRIDIQREVEQESENLATNRYRAFLQGLLGDNTINAVELQQLNTFRIRNKVNDNLHNAVLVQLGFTEETFEKMKNFVEIAAEDNECVICFDAEADHLIMDCGHLTVCEECVDTALRAPDATCPNCRETIKSIHKVHM